MDRPDQAPVVTSVDTQAAAWRDGRLEYRGERLKYVIADVNRYLQEEIVIADPAAGELLVTGTVFADDAQAWVSGLEAFLPVLVQEEDDGRLLLRARKASTAR
jgi:transmembrane sensor